jgi:hypothetical protein
LSDTKLSSPGRDRFIPVRKSDILDALIERGALVGSEACAMLASIYHYEYFATLERLRGDYYYFNPSARAHTLRDQAITERAYADLVQALDRVLRVANFVELSHRSASTGAATMSRKSRACAGSACSAARSKSKSTTTSSCWLR